MCTLWVTRERQTLTVRLWIAFDVMQKVLQENLLKMFQTRNLIFPHRTHRHLKRWRKRLNWKTQRGIWGQQKFKVSSKRRILVKRKVLAKIEITVCSFEAQGMMDLALVSANCNQLRYVLDMSAIHPYFLTSMALILCSLTLQVIVGLMLLYSNRQVMKLLRMRFYDFPRPRKTQNSSLVTVTIWSRRKKWNQLIDSIISACTGFFS